MGSFKVEVSGKDIVDKMNRQSALATINKHGSTEALILLAEMVEKPGASNKFVKNGNMLKSFI
ncbi:hypothetical protein CXF68_12345 [Tenacibaculum sp. Bg11-29]|uniref:hypothetical protein n=1 Tax=Tenacibaculum sp. Bg11-29 TaxID=2058306 RepID=UPI000C3248DD|nr:hypothetical protein [Tenacibaculum sp. Bg11-29]PKH51422.1 hypothetical protein CXF68_12345 [Tenacibaculum sp. Bg11-29]